MTGKLDQSLDEILKDRRQSARPRRTRRLSHGARATPAYTTPIGGVKKSTRASKTATKALIPTGPSGAGESKIIVSSLPTDVNETQIKDYFNKTIGPVKKALLTYGPNGQSRGVATIIFSKLGSASEAAKTLDGLKVDNRPMKIEVVVGAKDAPPPIPVRSLSDRISNTKPAVKPQPRPATVTKTSNGKGRAKRGRNAGRSKTKTAEELDAEMADYWVTTANGGAAGGSEVATVANGNGTAQPVVNGGDTGMDDEIL